MLSAQKALERLKKGNHEFASTVESRGVPISRARRNELVNGQDPFAIILSCSDSRVPAEIIFNQGVGDLFVIRVAGNIAAPTQIGSVEFAAAYLGSRLVVVLGHSQCGAIAATLNELKQPSGHHSSHLLSIIDTIRPALMPLMQTELRHDAAALGQEAVRANVRAAVGHLRHGSDILVNLAQNEGLRIVGAEYSLESGKVEFHHEDEI